MSIFPEAVKSVITERVSLEDAASLLRQPGGIKQVVTIVGHDMTQRREGIDRMNVLILGAGPAGVTAAFQAAGLSSSGESDERRNVT